MSRNQWSPWGELKHERAAYQLTSLQEDCRIDAIRGKRLLEIGCGNGLFLQHCHEAGLLASGLEVDRESYDAAKRQYPHLDIIHYDGLNIPKEDQSFDIVVSYQVIEHVEDIEQTLKECSRVLKPGGMMYHTMPNYQSFYEGHYQILWLPFLTKNSGRLYMKMLKKYNPFYETLNIVKPQLLKRLMRKFDHLEMVSLGKQEFVRRFTLQQISKIGNLPLRKLIQGVYRLSWLRNCIIYLLLWTNMYYPIILIARKK